MTPTWVTIVVAVLSGIAGSILSTWLRGQHERRSWLRGQLLVAGADFSRAIQLAFGPVQAAIVQRFDEPEEFDDDAAPEDDPSGEQDEAEESDLDLGDGPHPFDYWSPETIDAYRAAEASVLKAEAALSPLLLLLADESVPIVAGSRAISMLGSAVGSLDEIPRDTKTLSDLYRLQAQIEWHAFNEALRRELPRAGRRSARWRRLRERRQYEQWAEEKFRQRTHNVDGETRLLA
jgi:hypothetical protein